MKYCFMPMPDTAAVALKFMHSKLLLFAAVRRICDVPVVVQSNGSLSF
jgi:hypothetical protein